MFQKNPTKFAYNTFRFSFGQAEKNEPSERVRRTIVGSSDKQEVATDREVDSKSRTARRELARYWATLAISNTKDTDYLAQMIFG